MQTITQDATPSKFSNSKSSTFDKESKDDFFDDYTSRIYTTSKIDRELEMMGFDTIEPIESNTNISSMFSPTSSTALSSNKNSNISDQPSSYSSSNGSNNRNGGSNNSSSSKVTPGGTKYNTYENDSAQKKFGGAKAISSDQFFNNEASSFERSANLAKFQGSNSISSVEYFGDSSTSRRGNGGGGGSSGGAGNMSNLYDYVFHFAYVNK